MSVKKEKGSIKGRKSKTIVKTTVLSLEALTH